MNDAVKLTLSLALALGVGGCFFDPADAVCPEGWSFDTEAYRCAPAADELTEIEEAVGAGAYGYVRTVEGGCGPGDDACVVTLLARHELRFAPVERCDWDLVPTLTDDELASFPSATTDARGVYQVSLSAGSRCVISTDPITNERIREHRLLDVGTDGVTAFDVTYDHGAY